MNLYFLVEGITERKILPKWLNELLPNFTQVDSPSDSTNLNYYLITGGGLPRLLDEELPEAAANIIAAGNYDYLIIILDADELTAAERAIEVQDAFITHNIHLGHCQTEVIVQNRCL